MYNPHLGLINTPPLFVVFLQTTFFTIHLLSKRPEIYWILAKTLLIRFCDTGDTSWVILEVILGVKKGIIHFLSKRDPPQKWSVVHVNHKSNVRPFEPRRPGVGHPQDHPQDDSKLLFCVALINLSWYLCFVFINFRGPGTSIHGGGLLIQGGVLIQGGDYIYINYVLYISMCMYVYMYIHIYIYTHTGWVAEVSLKESEVVRFFRGPPSQGLIIYIDIYTYAYTYVYIYIYIYIYICIHRHIPISVYMYITMYM